MKDSESIALLSSLGVNPSRDLIVLESLRESLCPAGSRHFVISLKAGSNVLSQSFLPQESRPVIKPIDPSTLCSIEESDMVSNTGLLHMSDCDSKSNHLASPLMMSPWPARCESVSDGETNQYSESGNLDSSNRLAGSLLIGLSGLFPESASDENCNQL
jgi:hypothetical protein